MKWLKVGSNEDDEKKNTIFFKGIAAQQYNGACEKKIQRETENSESLINNLMRW